MGKTRKGERRRRDDDDDGVDDVEDVASGSVRSHPKSGSDSDEPGSPLSPSAQYEDDIFAEMVDKLSDKNAPAREKALTYIDGALASYFCVDKCAQMLDTVAHSVAKIVRSQKSTVAERCHASKLAAVLATTFGGSKFDTEMSSELAFVVKDPTTPFNVCAAAAMGLAVVSFMTPECDVGTPAHPGTVTNILSEKFSGKIGKQDPKVMQNALDGFGLLMTRSVPSFSPFDQLNDRYADLVRLLENDSSEVVIAACEDLALLHQYSQERNTPHPLRRQLEESISTLQRFHEHSATKETKKTQKAALRRVLTTITEHEHPTEKVKLKNVTLEFESWPAIKQIAALRGVLGTGFSQHLIFNPIVRDLLDVHTDLTGATRKPTKDEKRENAAAWAEQEKRTTIARGRERRKFATIHDDDGDF